MAKIITGLYESDEGEILINGKTILSSQLGEYMSVVFNPLHLFQKIYEVDTESKQDQIEEYLQLLDLADKVSVQDATYSTIELSQGQRKRLALMQCFLEDRPIYLFDEWAADQDPAHRRFFYETLIPHMKQQGKLIIAITHDDAYFHIADQIVKLDLGKQAVYQAISV